MHELFRSFQNAAAGEIGRFAGHLAKFLGDGALAYFGWPTAHERAVGAALALLGDAAGSEQRGDEAVAMARGLGNPHGLTWALVCAGVAAMFTENAARVHSLQDEALSIAQTYHLPQWTGFSTNYLGWALLAESDPQAGLDAASRGLALVHATGAVLNTTVLLWTRAQCRLAMGDAPGATADIDAALAHADSHDEGVILPGLLWLAGKIARARDGDPVPFWRRAREVADRQGALAWLRRLEQSEKCIKARESER